MKELWKTSSGISNIEAIKIDAWRIVEDQGRSSTRKMVSTPEEHELLEKMIDRNKPTLKFYGDEFAFAGLHYLLFTPFRYPPLKSGTRFGTRTERNLFYSSLDLDTALCEKAFHRLSFLLASEGKIGGKSVNCTAFNVNINTKKGIDLCKKPFSEHRDRIASPLSYSSSQELGSCMRNDGVQAFISYSARSLHNGKNLNAFTPLSFDKNQSIENTFHTYSCYSTKSTVEYYSNRESMKEPVVFRVDAFYVDGQFPIIF